MELQKDQVPSGGWYFLEGNLRIEGDSYKELVENVEAHRLNNGKVTGYPEEEIKKQIENR